MSDRITGTQVIVDLCGLDHHVCLAGDIWLDAFRKACELLNLNEITSYIHDFKPPKECGITAYMLLDASHFSIHTYAGSGQGALDLFACKVKNLDLALRLIMNIVGINNSNIAEKRVLKRFNNL